LKVSSRVDQNCPSLKTAPKFSRPTKFLTSETPSQSVSVRYTPYRTGMITTAKKQNMPVSTKKQRSFPVFFFFIIYPSFSFLNCPVIFNIFHKFFPVTSSRQIFLHRSSQR